MGVEVETYVLSSREFLWVVDVSSTEGFLPEEGCCQEEMFDGCILGHT